MIFVTVGSTTFPFERLVGAVSQLAGEEVVIQHGPVAPPAGLARSQAFMPFPEILHNMESAQKVVSHAGVGSILSALRAGHTPIVVPRLRRFGETVDDHQVELVDALAAEGKVVAVADIARLGETVRDAPERQESVLPIAGPLQRAVRDALTG